MRILVLNAGSSTLKASLIDQPGDVTVLRDLLETTSADAWQAWLADHLGDAPPDAVGHRIVHGGTRHGPLRLDADAIEELETLRRLAPLHNGPALELVGATRIALPSTPQFACFDTDFHASLPPAAVTYPVPHAWMEQWGVRRFGFHGLSVEWAVDRTAALLQRPVAELGVVVAHLGSGCSVTAVAGGKSVDTSMGMTPLEGLMMGSRSGSIDPGMILELLGSATLSLADLGDALQHQSGLLGVSGVSADLREVREAAANGHPRATLAVEMFVRRAAAGIAAAATTLPRRDALAFTGGIGANDTDTVRAICARLAALGVPAELHAGSGSDAVVSPEGAAVAVVQVAAREDVVIARQVASASREA